MPSDDDPAGTDDEYAGPLGYAFAVADKPFCCWEYDHGKRTLEFLDGLDPDYFATMAMLLGGQLESDDALAMSVTLRMLYAQAIEALLALLGATVQAPEAIPAWIASCSTQNLDEVAQGLKDGATILTQDGRQRVSFIDLSEQVHRYAWTTETGSDSTAARFGRFWHRLATDYLDDVVRAEHNALKHGHRVAAGGFSLAIGVEEQPGVPAPAEAMRSMGSSKYGTTFFRAERVGTTKHHIRARRTSVNWSAVAVANRLQLISMSMSNVVAALRCDLGMDPTTVQFHRPEHSKAFDEVWDERVGVRHSNMDSLIRIGTSDELSPNELLEDLEGRTPTG